MEGQKKLLLLGGSAQQLIAIETAKRLGYYTVLCDFLPDNPGQYVTDQFYLVSTTDKEAVLEVAKREAIDGVLAYASDPAAPTAAYVAEKLGLHTNPHQSVETLCNKDQFRTFLKENGFNTPFAKGYGSDQCVLNDIDCFHLPVIVKPVDSSGSKGATVLHDWDALQNAVDFAFAYSRSKRIIVEEFIEKKHPYLIGGDIFVVDGQIVLWGLLNCHRDNQVNPLVPAGKSYPLALDELSIQSAREVLQCMVDKLGIRFGAMNVELIIDKDDRVWLIDVGPRNGGNMIPDLLGMIFNVDIVEMTVQAAMGETIRYHIEESNMCYATHNIHSREKGKFDHLFFSEKIQPFIVRKSVYKKQGDAVEYFDNASKALGVVFLKFSNIKEMNEILNTINEHVVVCLGN